MHQALALQDPVHDAAASKWDPRIHASAKTEHGHGCAIVAGGMHAYSSLRFTNPFHENMDQEMCPTGACDFETALAGRNLFAFHIQTLCYIPRLSKTIPLQRQMDTQPDLEKVCVLLNSTACCILHMDLNRKSQTPLIKTWATNQLNWGL